MMDYIIGIDIGTTATKGVLYDEQGKKIIEKSISYPLVQNMPNQAEENPNIIFDAVQQIIYALSRKVDNIVAISWSAQMHSIIGVDKDFNLLTNSITWADNRAEKIVEQAKETGLAQQIYQKTGMPMHPMAPVYKLLWLKQEYPQVFSKVRYWLGIKEYIIYRLTGILVEDITTAAGKGMLNVNTLDWDEKILNKIGIKKKQLPSVKQPIYLIKKIISEYCKKLSLNLNTAIVIGASDGYLSTVGVGVLNQTDFALNVGTSGAIRTLVKQPILDKDARFFCYPASKDAYLLGGPINNGGIAFEWARKTIFEADETSQDFLNIAQTVPAGSNGLLFHPYLGGERAPIWNAHARGSFVGLTRNHTKPQMARSVLEGIIFNLLGASYALCEDIGYPKELRVTGGFVQTDFIKQMLANIFNLPVIAMKDTQGGTLAAMFLARLALGMSRNFTDIKEYVKEDKVYFPDEKEARIYQEIIPLYREIEHKIDQSYAKIAFFQEKYPDLFK